MEYVHSDFSTNYGEVKLPHLWLLYLSSHFLAPIGKKYLVKLMQTDAGNLRLK